MSQSARYQLLLVVICCVTYLPNLGATHLWDEDEAYFGSIAREMAARHDLVVPYFNGEISVHKPPLMYWVMIAGFRVFGENEFAARIGSTSFGIANVLLTYHIGRLLFSARAGFWSALALATCIQFAVIARAAVADQELLFFCTIPILVLAAGTRLNATRRNGEAAGGAIRPADVSWLGWALIYASMSVAVLDKGPVGFVLPTAVLGLFFMLSRVVLGEPVSDLGSWYARGAYPTIVARILGLPIVLKVVEGRRAHRALQSICWFGQLFSPVAMLRTIWEMRPLTAAAALAVIALPWYVVAGIETRGVWPREFFLVHNVGRFAKAFEGHHGGPFYYLIVICIGTYPWCIFLYHGLRLMVSGLKRGSPAQGAYLLLCSWVMVWLTAFTLAGTKLPHYVMPAYPAIAMVYGCFASASLAGTFEIGARWMRAAWLNPVIVGIAMLFVLPIATRIYLPGDGMLVAIALIPIAGGMVSLVAERRGARPIAFASLGATAVLLALAFLVWGGVRADRHQRSHVVAGWIRELSNDATPRLCTCGTFDASLVYYTQGVVHELGDGRDVAAFLKREPGSTFVLTTDKKFKEIQKDLPRDCVVLRKAPRFLKRGELLLLGESPAVARGRRIPKTARSDFAGASHAGKR